MRKERKTTNLNVRVTPKLRRAVERQAKEMKMSKSKFLVWLIGQWFEGIRFGRMLRESAKGGWQDANIAEVLKKAAEESLR